MPRWLVAIAARSKSAARSDAVSVQSTVASNFMIAAAMFIMVTFPGEMKTAGGAPAVQLLRRPLSWSTKAPRCGSVAQSVEQRPFKALVPGSSPGRPIYKIDNKSRSEFFQDLENFGIQLPDAGLGEMFVGDLNKIVAIKLAQRRRGFIEDKIDKLTPPIFVIVFAWSVDWWPRRH